MVEMNKPATHWLSVGEMEIEMPTKYIFEVQYEQIWQSIEEGTNGQKRVAVGVYDAQAAVDTVRAMALGEESDYLMTDGETFAKCEGFCLTGVKFVTDFEDALEVEYVGK